MTGQIYVKPRDPKAVMADPVTKRILPPEGMWVAPSLFWTRRELAQEIDITDGPSSSSAAAPTGREPVSPLTTR